MAPEEPDTALQQKIHEFIRSGFTPHFGELTGTFESHPTWARLRELGTELWLDTGSLEDSEPLWTREFSALTTNNTLLNREVQKGQYDQLIAEAAELLGDLDERARILEIAFILNARHGLRLVEKYDAFVSVEEHTLLANDLDAAVAVARRYHAICPERFYVKLPLTAAGLLATRILGNEGVPVNHTLVFSLRQAYTVTRIGRPAFVSLFLGRLNSFVADNGLGSGTRVGERATLAGQAALESLRRSKGAATRQVGASFRSGGQVRDLAGMDVMTLPPSVAAGFLELGLPSEQITDKTAENYDPPLAAGVDPKTVGLDTLWDVDDALVACLDALEAEDLDGFTPDDLVTFFAEHGCGDVLVDWSDEQVALSAAEGKIPKLENWKDALAAGTIGLDSLMNLAGLNSFGADQKAMDDRVAGLLGG